MRNDVIKAMQKVVDMYWHEEQRDWEELDNPDDHVFHAFNTIKNYLVGRRGFERIKEVSDDNSQSNEVK